MNKKIKKTLAAGVLATSLLANGATVQANVPTEKVDTTVEDDNTILARTSADWKKILEEYSKFDFNPDQDCNLLTQPIYDVVEVSEFIRDNYEYYTGESIETISHNIIVDDVISYRNELNTTFSYKEIIDAYKALDLDDEQAVIAFLKKYGQYLPDLNAHIEYSLITIMTAIRKDFAWYVRQDIENSDFIKEAGYDFLGKRNNGLYQGGEIAVDLSNVKFFYDDTDVVVNLTAPNDEYETVGDGFVDIQNTYYNVLREVNYLGEYHNGILEEADKEYFLAEDTYETSGKTIDETYDLQETYEVYSNQEVNNLVRDGLRIVETFTPATVYRFEELYNQGIDVTALGYGHWFVPNPDGQMISSTYDEASNKEIVNLTETFEKPTLSLTDEQEEVYRLTR